MPDLDDIKALAEKESGLTVAITTRRDGSPRASVVNAGVLAHPETGERVVGFVSRGSARKLSDLRVRPLVTVVFRSGWEWVAVEGTPSVIGPEDPAAGFDAAELLGLVCSLYAAAVGGSPADWSDLKKTMATERHTEVLVSPTRLYATEQ